MDQKWAWQLSIGVLVGCLVAAGLAGCSPETREKVLSVFFDGTKAPPPPQHRVRRDLLREIEELNQELAEAQAASKARKESATTEEKLPAEEAKTWPEAAELLPKDKAGQVDWIQAVTAGTITPRPGLDPNTPQQAVLDMNVELSTLPTKVLRAIFPHNPHTQWLTCGNCHPAIFPLGSEAGPAVITMAMNRAGQYCGVCHGKVAFDFDGACPRCHVQIPAKAEWHPSEEPRKPIERAASWDEAAKLLPVTQGMPDWAKALTDEVIAPRPGVDPKTNDEPVFPLDVELVPADNPLFKVVFPHQTHTALLACTNCHPGIFQMAKGADPITMEKIYKGEYCGVCHGKVAFAVPTGCVRCHPVMAGG